MEANIGLTEETRQRSCVLLNGLLADHFTLMLKVWQFHWNVVGKAFGSYHADMKALYESEFDRVDEVAERIRALGGTPLQSMNEMLQHNRIPESTGMIPTASEMWNTISTDWDSLISIIRSVHSSIPSEDIGTKSFLEAMIEDVEKEAWMNRARLAE